MVIFSMHVPELAEAVTDEIKIMRKGAVVAKGLIDELKGKKDLESYFLEVTGLSSEVRELVEASSPFGLDVSRCLRVPRCLPP